MNQQLEGWNQYYSNLKNITTDPWLDSYKEYFEEAENTLDLGCGNGCNIPFLLSTGAVISAVDYSEKAIADIRSRWNVTALVHDIRNPLPFPDNSFDVVLADLSIQYFSISETQKIVNDLYRVMMNKGVLIGRLNSIDDFNYGVGKGKMIEPNFFEHEGVKKRFFDRQMIDFFFNDRLTLLKAAENESDKYGRSKRLWEFVSKKPT